MDLETAQITTTAKLPTLKQGEYDMWRLRIEQYFQVQDYALWDVIENGNSFKPAAKTTTNADGTSTTLIPGHVTTEEKVQKKNDMKARSMLLMALPNEHLMTFNQYKDAKTLFAAIQTRFGVSTASTQVSTANLSDDTVYAFLAIQPNGSQLIYEDLEQIHEDDIEEMDLKWQLSLLSMRIRRGPRNHDNRNRNQDSSRRTVNVEEISSKAMLAIDGAGFDWSYMVDDEVPTNMALMDFSDSEPEFEGYGPKISKNISEDTSNKVRESPDAPMVKKLVSYDKLENKTVFPTVAKIEFVRAKQQEKPVKYTEMYRSQGPRGNQRNYNNQKSQQLGSDFVMYNKACFVSRSFNHVQANCNYHQREMVVSGNNYTRVNYNYSAKKAHPSAHRNMTPRSVLMKTGIRLLNTARPVNTAHPKTTVYSTRPMPKEVNTARPNLGVVNAVRANQVNAVKASACWVWRPTKLNSASITLKRHNYGHPQKEDQGYVDSGCSRHMTENMSYRSYFKEFDGGYVTFGGGDKGGKITCKGTLKTERELVRIKIDDGNAFWNEIEVKSGNSKVSTARALLSTVGHYLVLLDIT
ncbi:hypothetical protein Tco_0938870 [Tanacetum coccineum]|uniref:Retrovirus-related Pol polyprotein from transposon TNT 1-94-like beta-barrel domain-containing protein n=1 Tax=Tanacetum coccineum TaxID=301880 RepID=A0ABQ5DIE9_9ASTR